ncbi:DNA-binding GntR family transcriptional regulator [Rhodococcus sp. 27YEA15]|uniref:GntR family transcriptional regulator n=1 Tax=Rhodococcus sp. 27YEA15 TaxID=3156259 RepID=UPI003C7CACD6
MPRQADHNEAGPPDDGGGVYERLRSDLTHGAFELGAQLSEATLTARYGVSRTPIREALARLDQDALVERGPRGYQVRLGGPADILEIYEARIALEGVAAADAAERRTELELARLYKIHEQMCTSPEPSVILDMNSRFHQELWAAAHNNTISTLLQRLSAQLRLFDRGNRGLDDLDVTRAEHESILEAVATRDAAAAYAAATSHLARTREERINHFARTGLEP